MKSCREAGGYSKGGTEYPLDAPYASASGPLSENTGPDCAKTTLLKASIERNARIRRRLLVPPKQKDNRLAPPTIPSTKAYVRYWRPAQRDAGIFVVGGGAEVAFASPDNRKSARLNSCP